MLEIIEEDCLRKLLETGSECPIALLYLETGQLPARFQVQIMMLNFLKYIRQQEQNSLMSKFFRAQCNQPSKGDWVENIRKVIINIELNMSFEDIRQMKTNAFKKIVNAKVRKFAFNYLLSKLKSKGKEIYFGNNLHCQSYLCPNNLLTLQEQRATFSYRSRMNILEYNFPGRQPVTEKCRCGEDIDNKHLYECQLLNSSEKIVTYDKIFGGRLIEMKHVVKIMIENEIKQFFT